MFDYSRIIPQAIDNLYCFPLNTNSILKLHMLSAPTDYFVEKRA